MRCFLDETSYFHKIKKYCRVNWPGTGTEIITVGQTLKNFWRQLKPGTVEGGYVSPVPIDPSQFQELRAVDLVQMSSYLLRHIVRVEAEDPLRS